MPEFREGFQTGTQVGGFGKFFETLSGELTKAQKRREAEDIRRKEEDQERRVEEFKLQGAIEKIVETGKQERLTQAEKPATVQEQKFAREKSFQEILKGASDVGGGVAFEDVTRQFPERAEEIQELAPRLTPIEKDPEFQKGFGFPALFSPKKAKINRKTQTVIDQIKTQQDLDELLERTDEAQKAGIDVNAILEFFGKGG